MVAITERVRRFARRFHRPIRCTACQRPAAAAGRLISGPGVYICESCIAAVSSAEDAADSATRCSFCGRRGVRIARTWPKVAICVPCIELSRNVLAEDDRRSRPAT
jgi:hypothetical protein